MKKISVALLGLLIVLPTGVKAQQSQYGMMEQPSTSETLAKVKAMTSGLVGMISEMRLLIEALKETAFEVRYNLVPRFKAERQASEKMRVVAQIMNKLLDDMTYVSKFIADLGEKVIRPLSQDGYITNAKLVYNLQATNKVLRDVNQLLIELADVVRMLEDAFRAPSQIEQLTEESITSVEPSSPGTIEELE